MMLKLIILVIISFGLLKTGKQNTKSDNHFKIVSNFPDSFPPAISLADADIDTATGSYKTKIITVKMKMGDVYTYNIKDWNWEYEKKLNRKIGRVVELLDRTFTKAEQMPAYPGGDEAWNNYIKKFWEENKQLLKHKRHGSITIQAIIDNNGELSDVRPIEGADEDFADFAVNAVKQSAFWIPAVQNGHIVVCFQRILVKF